MGQGKEDPALLEAHTQLMFDNRRNKAYCGFLWTIERVGKELSLVATCHNRIADSWDWAMLDQPERFEYTLEVLHPAIKESLSKADVLYVELNTHLPWCSDGVY